MAEPKGLKSLFDFRREELPFALLMFSYFFLVISTFWILKPVKKALFIGFYDQRTFELLGASLSGPQAEQLAKVLNMLVAFAAASVFTVLSKRLRRQRLTFAFSAFFLACNVAYGTVLSSPGAATVWSFYLFGDLFSTVMVAAFFAFLNDSVTPNQAKRIYGLVGLGGVTGGAFGSMVVNQLIGVIPRDDWMWVCSGLVCVIVGIAWAAGRMVDRYPPPEAPAAKDDGGEQKAGMIDAARVVFRSRYLISIVAIVGLYEIVSSVMDFQFTATVAHYLSGAAMEKQFTTVYMITNLVAMLVQLLLTSFVMTRMGVGFALLILPCAMMAVSGSFLAFPILWVGSMLNTADGGFSYSINQSAKEALYVPTTREEKYKAKAFIDMFVQRFGKALAVVVSLGITLSFQEFASVRWLTAFTVPMMVLWVIAARYAGRHFKELSEAQEESA